MATDYRTSFRTTAFDVRNVVTTGRSGQMAHASMVSAQAEICHSRVNGTGKHLLRTVAERFG